MALAVQVQAQTSNLVTTLVMEFTSPQDLTTPVLPFGNHYFFLVTGRYGTAPLQRGDAMSDGAFYNGGDATPLDQYHIPNYGGWIWNGTTTNRPTPDVYQTNHVYRFNFTGRGAAEVLTFLDSIYSDNVGTLTFDLYEIPPLDYGLVAYYPFNGNANDASGRGNDGLAIGATLATNRFGTSGCAYRFDGSSSSNVIIVASLASSNFTELTLSAWVRPFAYPSGPEAIIEKWRGYSYSLEDYSFWLESDLRVALSNGRHGTGYYDLPNHCQLRTTNTLSLGNWYHLVATLDSAGTGKLWVNGILRAADNILQLLPAATEPVRIGQSFYASGAIGGAFNGLIDDIRIYNRALSGSEVQQLYVYESGPRVNLIKAVKPSFNNLTLTTNYQLQGSADMSTWTNQGSAFTATNTSMVYPQYWDVDNWNSLYFRLQVAP